MAINLLDKHTAELIAAGEVVERPASVVKELVENAIDAGATSVSVEIEGGGIALIRVADNGGGIERVDLPLAFVRHATSKVKTKADLEAIGTLGFRGEALASIGSVARVRILTKHPAEADAAELVMQGGELGEISENARPAGTTIEVRELFYNTPARMKFLKKDSSEAGFVTETVGRLALSHAEVAMRYSRDGKQVFATAGDGDLRAAAWQVLGKDFAKELVELDEQSPPYRVRGLVTPPRLGRASRGMQYFFINGRFVKNRTMMAALEQAYRGMAMVGRFPGGLLFLQMPPELVDVNVHPAKTEVRFAREQEVFAAVYRAVKAALVEISTRHHGQLDLSAAGREEGPKPAPPPHREHAPAPQAPEARQLRAAGEMLRTTAEAADMLASEPAWIPYQTKAKAPAVLYPQKPAPLPDERRLDIEAEAEPEHASVPGDSTGSAPAAAVEWVGERPADGPEEKPNLRLVGEVFKTYILAEAGEVMCLIDKHAAHERLLYEKIAAARDGADTQLLLAPVTVNLSATEKQALLENGEALSRAGIQVEDFGGGAVLVRGVPADVENTDISGLVAEVAGRLAVNPKDNLNAKTEWVLHSMACRAAVKAGDNTPPGALLALAQSILNGEVPPFCPHGRPVVLEITRKELEKQFGRLG